MFVSRAQYNLYVISVTFWLPFSLMAFCYWFIAKCVYRTFTEMQLNMARREQATGTCEFMLLLSATTKNVLIHRRRHERQHTSSSGISAVNDQGYCKSTG